MDKLRRPRDTNQLAKHIVDLAVGEKVEEGAGAPASDMAKLGRLGGLRGGIARAASLSPERRQEIARAAAAARWRTD